MLTEWTDRLSPQEAAAIDRRAAAGQFEQRLSAIENALSMDASENRLVVTSFYDAMRHFLMLRNTMFPGLPADPVWQILVTLAREPEDGDRSSVTSIAYGAEVPLTTALRYIAALEIEGIVERVPCTDDKRRVFIRLTAEGRRRLDVIADKWALRLLCLLAIPCGLLALLLQ